MYLTGWQAEISNIIRHCTKAYLYFFKGGGGKLYIYEEKKIVDKQWIRFFIKKKLFLVSLFDGALKLQFQKDFFYLSIEKFIFFFNLRMFLYHKMCTKCCIYPPVDFSEYKVANLGAGYL